MEIDPTWLIALPPLAMLALPLTLLFTGRTRESRWADTTLRRGLTGWVAGQTLLAATGLIWVLSAGEPIRLVAGGFDLLLIDAVAAVMLLLVSFVGWVICGFSARQLAGDPQQTSYYCWVGFTVGCVSLMVISGNLLQFVGLWSLTSLGLHNLLLHFGDRPQAQRAAWTKFTVSRLGDVALVVGLVMIFAEFQTFSFAELFARTATLSEVSGISQFALILFVLGACAKTAQVPFHTWLPLTLETPTPVSALMHAGVVNAGGYFMIRMSPLLDLSPLALPLLATIGALTACYGAVVMITQPSVKKALAYSTIAQMGFMMMQCGLGAITAALLHILAHSLYKAHAFLTSGSVLAERRAMLGAAVGGAATTSPLADWKQLWRLPLITAVVAGIFLSTAVLLRIDLWSKPGGLLLGGIVTAALVGWMLHVWKSRSMPLIVGSLLATVVVCVAYLGSYAVLGGVVSASLVRVPGLTLAWLAVAPVLLVFSGLFVLQLSLPSSRRPQWLHGFYVHASNGFYIDQALRRTFGAAAGQP